MLRAIEAGYPRLSKKIENQEGSLDVFEEFYHNGVIGKSMNSNFITLVPKKDRSIKARDFRPIGLVTSVHKIITKVISRRLGEVLSNTLAVSKCLCWRTFDCRCGSYCK